MATQYANDVTNGKARVQKSWPDIQLAADAEQQGMASQAGAPRCVCESVGRSSRCMSGCAFSAGGRPDLVTWITLHGGRGRMEGLQAHCAAGWDRLEVWGCGTARSTTSRQETGSTLRATVHAGARRARQRPRPPFPQCAMAPRTVAPKHSPPGRSQDTVSVQAGDREHTVSHPTGSRVVSRRVWLSLPGRQGGWRSVVGGGASQALPASGSPGAVLC